MISEIDFRKLMQSVAYYLSYQDKIGKSFMIDESSLKYPVAEYLSSLKVSLSNIELEYPHPYLRNRKVDIVKLSNRKRAVEVAFEFKMTRTGTRYESEQKRIFNDLMRLYLLKKHYAKRCYFLVAGKQDDFIQHFRSIVTKKPKSTTNKGHRTLPDPRGFYTEWFSFKLGARKEFVVSSQQSDSYKSIYHNFLLEYKPRNDKEELVLPETLVTRCNAISALSVDYPIPYVGGIREIV